MTDIIDAKKPAIKAPLGLSEAAIEYDRAQDGSVVADAALDAATAALREARGAADQLAAALNATMVDPSMTPTQRTLKCKKMSDTLGEAIAKKLDIARNRIASELTAIDNSPAWHPPKPSTARDKAMESDVRQALRSMAPAQRLEAVNAAVNNNDTFVVAAAFTGPALLISMPNEERAALLQHWRKQHVPAWSRYARLQKAAARVDQAGQAAVGWIGKLAEDTGLSELVSKAEAARAAAAEAAKK